MGDRRTSDGGGGGGGSRARSGTRSKSRNRRGSRDHGTRNAHRPPDSLAHTSIRADSRRERSSLKKKLLNVVTRKIYSNLQGKLVVRRRPKEESEPTEWFSLLPLGPLIQRTKCVVDIVIGRISTVARSVVLRDAFLKIAYAVLFFPAILVFSYSLSHQRDFFPFSR